MIDRVINFFRPQANAELMMRSILLKHLSDAGVAVSPEIAMRFSTVYACVRLLSDTIAQMPCKLFDRKSNGDSNPDYSNPLYNLLSTSPENGLTAFDFWKKFVENFLYKGYAVARVIRNFDGNPARIILINKIQKVERNLIGEYVFTYYSQNNELLTLEQKDAFFSFFSLDDNMMPLSPIEVNRNSIGLGIAAEKHGCNVFKAGGNPSGALEYPSKLDVKVKEAIKEGWDMAYGINGKGGVAILEGGAKYAKISMSNEDAQYLQTRQFQKQDICGIFGVPPHLISDTAQAKGWSTMEQMMIEYIVLTTNPIAIRIEQSIKMLLIPRDKWPFKYAKFANNGLLRGDTNTRKDYYATGIDKGFLEINEVRRLEDMNALPEDRIKQIETRKQTTPPAAPTQPAQKPT